MHLLDLSDDQLLADLTMLHGKERSLVARILTYLVEVEERGLHLEAAYPSLYAFCIGELKLSEGEAYRRIRGAALVKRFPRLLGRIERGEIHLSALLILRRHLTESNWEKLVSDAKGKTTREVQELVALHFPKPDVASLILELPEHSASSSQTALSIPTASRSDAAATKNTRARIEPLSEAKYRMQLTASKALVDKVERAKDLMRHSNPTGDLSVVLDRAMDLLIEKLDKERFGKTTRPQTNPRPAKTNRVTRATTREVYARDQEQCTFVDKKSGNRCLARGFLELDHACPRALGGTSDAANARVLCKAHNLWSAEQAFGKEYVARCIERKRRSKVASVRTALANDNASAATQETTTSSDSLYELAKRAFVLMGFRDADVRRALATLRSKESATARPIESVIRDGLRLLT